MKAHSLQKKFRKSVATLFVAATLLQTGFIEKAFSESDSTTSRALFPIEENLPGRNTESGIVGNTVSLATHMTGHALYFGALGGLFRHPRQIWGIWTQPEIFGHTPDLSQREKEILADWKNESFLSRTSFQFNRTKDLPWVYYPAILGVGYGVYSYIRGTYSVAAIDENLNQIATRYKKKLLKKEKVIKDQKKTQQIRRIFNNLVAEANILYPHSKDYKWDLSIVDSKTVNAFCMPGGIIIVYSGILKKAKNVSGLAAVLGHEIGHALARHSAQDMKFGSIRTQVSQLIYYLGVQIVNFPLFNRYISKAINSFNTAFLKLPFSRTHETEADTIGLVLMARAGYDPREAPLFWERMSENEKNYDEFKSTHPSSKTRQAHLNQILEEVLPLVETAPQLLDQTAKLHSMK